MKFTEEEINRLEQQSLENLVHFYRSELLQVMRGQSAHTLLPDAVRKRLVANKIIVKKSRGRSHIHSITPLGMKILGLKER